VIRTQRGVADLDAYAQHPERSVHNPPTPSTAPAVSWINEPGKEVDSPNP